MLVLRNLFTPQNIKVARHRGLFVISVFICALLLIILRLAQIMVFREVDTDSRFCHLLLPSISRADIVDRNGIVVATSLPTVSLYANTHEMLDVEEAVTRIASVFSDINTKELSTRLKKSKNFVWIRRNLSPAQEQEVLNQGIPGFHFLRTERRVYPDRNLFSHIIGGTDIDNNGIAGIEKAFDHALCESTEPLVLSLDTKIQYAVRDELMSSIEEFKALGGAAIVMDVTTGEILSMVSLPDFDPNKSVDPTAKEKFNMVVSAAIEPGSSAKIFNTAMALESGITPFTQFDARAPIKIGRFTIHDFKGKCRFLSVEEILKYSSNIGSAKIATSIGCTAQKKFYKHLGLLDPISCELAETQRPIYPRHWTDVSAMTIAFGHGIAITPLHLITVVAGIVNSGIIQRPTVLKCSSPPPGQRIISTKTSKQMQALMRINVLEGANKYADAPGYFVGGKSGTAEKQKGGRYLKTANYTGFVGAFPMTNPKYAVYVVLDEPKATAKTHGYRTAGWIAAPTAARIIKRIAPLLNMSASQDAEPDWKKLLRIAS